MPAFASLRVFCMNHWDQIKGSGLSSIAFDSCRQNALRLTGRPFFNVADSLGTTASNSMNRSTLYLDCRVCMDANHAQYPTASSTLHVPLSVEATRHIDQEPRNCNGNRTVHPIIAAASREGNPSMDSAVSTSRRLAIATGIASSIAAGILEGREPLSEVASETPYLRSLSYRVARGTKRTTEISDYEIITRRFPRLVILEYHPSWTDCWRMFKKALADTVRNRHRARLCYVVGSSQFSSHGSYDCFWMEKICQKLLNAGKTNHPGEKNWLSLAIRPSFGG
jgi:hypothetical protein